MAQRTFSYKQYRAADLTIFAVILCALEAIICFLANKWVDTLYVVSLLYAVVAIVMMRWGCWAAIHCVLAGLVQCIVNGADAQQYIAYIVGDCFALLAMLLRDFVGKKKVRDSIWLTLAYLAIIYVSVNLGRALLLAVFKTQNLWNLLVMCFSTDILSLALAIVIVLIARRQNGLFEDQKQYLLRTEKERAKQLQKTNYEE